MKLTVTDVTPEYDWVIVKVDGVEVFSGHAVPEEVWCELLRKAGAAVTENTVDAHYLGMCGRHCPECQAEGDSDEPGESDSAPEG